LVLVYAGTQRKLSLADPKSGGLPGWPPGCSRERSLSHERENDEGNVCDCGAGGKASVPALRLREGKRTAVCRVYGKRRAGLDNLRNY